MKTFLKTYNDLIQSNDNYIEYIGLNIFKILNEWVESPDLLKFPKELQIELCKNLRNKCDNIYILSYQKIIQILEKYDYPYVDDISLNLQKFNKNGYLIFICLKIDETENFIENKTLNLIKANLTDIYDHAYDIFSKIYNNRLAEGLTIFHRDIFDPADEYTCIFVNRNATNMKDTLEHELTHFIRNAAKYSNKFPKVYSGITTNKLKSKQLQCVDYLFKLFKDLQFPMETCLSIKEIVLRAFTESEEQPTIKSIINAIIRYYENTDKTYLVNHKQKSIKQIENMLDENTLIEFRLNWLENFLEKLNSYEIFRENFELLNSYFSRKNYNKNKDVEFLLKCISYLCFKYNYPEYNIDEILKANFKKFRMRDV